MTKSNRAADASPVGTWIEDGVESCDAKEVACSAVNMIPLAGAAVGAVPEGVLAKRERAQLCAVEKSNTKM